MRCQEGYFPDFDSGNCEPCHYLCSQCIGQGEEECIDCQLGYEMQLKINFQGLVVGRQCVSKCTPSVFHNLFWDENDFGFICIGSNDIVEEIAFESSKDPQKNAVRVKQASTLMEASRNSYDCEGIKGKEQCSCHGLAYFLSQDNLDSFWCFCDQGFRGKFCEIPLKDFETLRLAQRKILEQIRNSNLSPDQLFETIDAISSATMDFTVMKQALDVLSYQVKSLNSAKGLSALLESFGNLMMHALDNSEFNRLNTKPILMIIYNDLFSFHGFFSSGESWVNSWENYFERNKITDKLAEILKNKDIVYADGELEDGTFIYNQNDGSFIKPSLINIQQLMFQITKQVFKRDLFAISPETKFILTEGLSTFGLSNMFVLTMVTERREEKKKTISTSLTFGTDPSSRVDLSLENYLDDPDKLLYMISGTVIPFSLCPFEVDLGTSTKRQRDLAVASDSQFWRDVQRVTDPVLLTVSKYTEVYQPLSWPITLKFYSAFDILDQKENFYYCSKLENSKWVQASNPKAEINIQEQSLKCQVDGAGTYAVFVDTKKGLSVPGFAFSTKPFNVISSSSSSSDDSGKDEENYSDYYPEWRNVTKPNWGVVGLRILASWILMQCLILAL